MGERHAEQYNGRKENPALLDKLVRLQLEGGTWGLHQGQHGYLLDDKKVRKKYEQLKKKFNAQDFKEMKYLKDILKEQINEYQLNNNDKEFISKVGNDDLLMFLAKLKVYGNKKDSSRWSEAAEFTGQVHDFL